MGADQYAGGVSGTARREAGIDSQPHCLWWRLTGGTGRFAKQKRAH